MKSMKSRVAAVAVIFTVTLASACGSGGGFNLVSIEEEWALGNQLNQDIQRQMPMNRDAQVNSYITSLGRQLVSQTEMRNLPWGFHVVQNPEINAFAIPGGHVYIHTGLIAASENASELAGVMGHEIAHGVARHGTQQLSRAYGLQVIAALALGQNPAVYQQILAQVIGAGTMARYSREAEREADTLGVRYMYDAGYNPNGMVTMFQKLMAQQQRQPSSVEQFFSTHPLTQDRVNDVSRQIQSLPSKSGLMTNDTTFSTVRARVR